MLQRIKSKKGFTLAELLIVVAIIAVLTAIAVPLFVNALNNAENRVKDANIRAVRGAAVEKILMNDDTGVDYQHITSGSETKNAKAWEVTAYVTADGGISEMSIKPLETAGTFETKCADTTDTDKTKGKYKVTVLITELTATLGA